MSIWCGRENCQSFQPSLFDIAIDKWRVAFYLEFRNSNFIEDRFSLWYLLNDENRIYFFLYTFISFVFLFRAVATIRIARWKKDNNKDLSALSETITTRRHIKQIVCWIAKKVNIGYWNRNKWNTYIDTYSQSNIKRDKILIQTSEQSLIQI